MAWNSGMIASAVSTTLQMCMHAENDQQEPQHQVSKLITARRQMLVFGGAALASIATSSEAMAAAGLYHTA